MKIDQRLRKPNFEMFTEKNRKVLFRLKSGRNQTLLTGRGLDSKSEAIQAIALVMRYGAFESRFVRKMTITGKHYFQLRTPSGRIIAWSEMYHSFQGRENGILEVRRVIQQGRVLDLN